MIIVSACLLGERCKYNGNDNYSPAVADYLDGCEHISCCPELLGGLGVPRPPVELVDGRAINREGEDVTAAFEQGSQAVLALCQEHGARLAILKDNSPSCGVHSIYDGSFSGHKIPGQGKCAAKLTAHGIEVISEEDVARMTARKAGD